MFGYFGKLKQSYESDLAYFFMICLITRILSRVSWWNYFLQYGQLPDLKHWTVLPSVVVLTVVEEVGDVASMVDTL